MCPGRPFLRKSGIFVKKGLTAFIFSSIIVSFYGGIAQLARACGSYPQCHWFESNYRYQGPVDFFRPSGHFWPDGQAVKTPPFHGGNTGSIPVRVTKNRQFSDCLFFFCIFLYVSYPPPGGSGWAAAPLPVSFSLTAVSLLVDLLLAGRTASARKGRPADLCVEPLGKVRSSPRGGLPKSICRQGDGDTPMQRWALHRGTPGEGSPRENLPPEGFPSPPALHAGKGISRPAGREPGSCPGTPPAFEKAAKTFMFTEKYNESYLHRRNRRHVRRPQHTTS